MDANNRITDADALTEEVPSQRIVETEQAPRKRCRSETDVGEDEPTPKHRKLESDATEHLLAKPFLLRCSDGLPFASCQSYDSFIFHECFNADALDWQNFGLNELTTTRSGEHVRTFHTTDSNIIVALIKLQGRPGVPRLVAYKSKLHLACAEVSYALEEYPSTTPQPVLSIDAMIRELLSVLKTIHDECIELGHINSGSVRWQGDQIKFTQWNSLRYRGNAFNDDFSCPAKDVLDAGKLIHEWSKLTSADEQRLNRLAAAMMNRCSYRQLSLEAALLGLDHSHIVEQYFERYGDVSNMTLKHVPKHIISLININYRERLKCCGEDELNEYVWKLTDDMFEHAPNMTHNEAAKHAGITKCHAVHNHSAVFNCRLEDKRVVAKACLDSTMRSNFALELLVSQLLSGTAHCPKLIKFHLYKNPTHKEDKFNIMMVFERYSSRPPEGSKDIRKLAVELLTAIEAMHDAHLVHSDIAPKNIVWDDQGRVVLIDYGSSYYANALLNGTFVIFRPYGHEGFMPKERTRYFATDVYEAGKTIEYFAREWGQWTNQIEEIVQLMTVEHWAARCSVKKAKDLFNEREQASSCA